MTTTAPRRLVYRKNTDTWCPDLDVRRLDAAEYAWMKSGAFYRTFEFDADQDDDSQWWVGPAPIWSDRVVPTTDEELSLYVESIRFWGVDATAVPASFFAPLFGGTAICGVDCENKDPLGVFLSKVGNNNARIDIRHLPVRAVNYRLVGVLDAYLSATDGEDPMNKCDAIRLWLVHSQDDLGDALLRVILAFARRLQATEAELWDRLYNMVVGCLVASAMNLDRLHLLLADVPPVTSLRVEGYVMAVLLAGKPIADSVYMRHLYCLRVRQLQGLALVRQSCDETRWMSITAPFLRSAVSLCVATDNSTCLRFLLTTARPPHNMTRWFDRAVHPRVPALSLGCASLAIELGVNLASCWPGPSNPTAGPRTGPPGRDILADCIMAVRCRDDPDLCTYFKTVLHHYHPILAAPTRDWVYFDSVCAAAHKDLDGCLGYIMSLPGFQALPQRVIGANLYRHCINNDSIDCLRLVLDRGFPLTKTDTKSMTAYSKCFNYIRENRIPVTGPGGVVAHL